MQILPADDSFRLPPDDSHPWRDAQKGEKWGGDFKSAWFKGEFTVPNELEGKKLWLLSKVNSAESLIFVDGVPKGIFDRPDDMAWDSRIHELFLFTDKAKSGKSFTFALDSYAGNMSYGVHPFDTVGNCERLYPYDVERTYGGAFVVEVDETVDEFLRELRVLRELYQGLGDNENLKGKIIGIMDDVFAVTLQKPEHYPTEVWKNGIIKAREAMAPFFAERLAEDEPSIWGEVGLIGHSHLDTAWLWPVNETIRKAARTFSNALSLMEKYPEYTFVQSSVVHTDWMKRYYPDIYDGIKKRTAEGRWEPNGGAWVECDGNMVGGEYLVRQFLRGQLYQRENLNYESDCFWEPDTFGYSPAIPQIMKGCNMKYFLTTKIGWNEANYFPFDTFIWRGIDGSEVLTHFNLTHNWPSAADTLDAVRNQIRQKDISDKKLMSYGFGDGGGGPSVDMLEMSRKIQNLPVLPKTKHTTVSEFMKRIEATARDLPVYDGELYLELHRGTLTQMHDIKRSNRFAEIALRELDILNVHSKLNKNTDEVREKAEMLDTLLLNQFHDILPGTTLVEVHNKAISQNYAIVDKAREISGNLLCDKKSDNLTVYNTLSWDFLHQVTVSDNGLVPDGLAWQRYEALDGGKKLVIGGINLEPLSAKSVKMMKLDGDKAEGKIPFEFSGDMLETPFATVKFTKSGEISSFIDKSANREIVADADKPLNSFYMGEDVPWIWDNWDIDYDQFKKMKIQTELISSEIVSCGPLQFRIRNVRKIGQHSVLKQDIVFYSDNPRVDFESVLDWKDVHSFLKTSFPVNIRSTASRHETQFGNIERPNHENTPFDKAKFEVCNHRWTDLSETRYGVAILNDCKYGISVSGNDMRLSLHKGGTHPDYTGDMGVHSFTYSLLPHNSGFCADTVVRAGYELNNKPLAVYGESSAVYESLAYVNAPNVIIETVKSAEDGNGFILRLYESECSLTNCTLKVNAAFNKACETNMLEDELSVLSVENGEILLEFKPFEIKTLRFS